MNRLNYVTHACLAGTLIGVKSKRRGGIAPVAPHHLCSLVQG